MRPTWIALSTGLLPIIGVAASYLIAVDAGNVPTCVPFWEGCTSVSATGRYFPAKLAFNAAMFPAAALTIVFWLASLAWLKALGATPGKALAAIPAMGVVAGLFLVVYVTFLGTHSELYSFLRRLGVVGYFGFTYLAQAFITRALWNLPLSVSRRPVRVMLFLLLGQLVLGLTSVIADVLKVDTNQLENIIEWNFGLLMMLFFIASAWAWRRSGFVLHPVIR